MYQSTQSRELKGNLEKEHKYLQIMYMMMGYYTEYWDFPVAQMVKNMPAVQGTRVRSLDREEPMEKGMAIHSSILAWRIPWTEKPSRLQSVGL